MNQDNQIVLNNSEVPGVCLPPGASASIDTRDEQISLVQFWRILQKRRWLVVCSLVAIVAVITTVSFLIPKRYDASSRVLLDMEGNDALGLEQIVMPIGLDLNTKLETQIRIVQSDTIAITVIKQLGLHHKPEFAGQLAVPLNKDFDDLDVQQRARLLTMFHKYLTVQLIPKTQIIEIHFRSKSPALASEVADVVANTYIEHNFQTKYRATLQTSDWLTKQLDDLKKHAETSQESLIAYQKKTGILGTDETHNIITEKLDELNKQLSTAEGDRIVKEAKYRIAMSENPELIASVLPESVLGALYKQRAQSKAELAQMTAKYGASYPPVLQLKSEIDDLNSSIQQEVERTGERVRAEYQAALKSEQMLDSSLERQKQEAFKLNGDAIQYAILRRDVESSRDLYEGLLKKLKEAGILAGLKSSNINVIDRASIPVEPVEPKIPLNIGLGCLGGLLFGVALAFVVENVDTSIRTPEDVENYCNLPSLGIVPSVPAANKSEAKLMARNGRKGPIRPVAIQDRNSGSAEAYRALRTSLLLSSPVAPPQVFMITSAMMQEGKSFTAVNLAVVLAQTGKDVLLIDSDMRRPAVNKYLGIPMNAGLSSCLAGAEDPDSVIVKVEDIPGLHVVPAGPMPPYPSEMLASDAMPQLLRKWRQRFRYIVLDTPPVLAVTDATVCAKLADVVVLIARSQQTGRQSLVRTRDLLRKVRANIAGVVVNDLSLNSVEYRQYYGYYGNGYYQYYSPDKKNGNNN